MRIKYPKKEYRTFDSKAPFHFEYPVYSEIVPDTAENAEPYWYNIIFPDFDATIYLSYKRINNNLGKYIEDSRILAYKHTIKAEAINENVIYQPEIPMYGILYDLKGNTASSLQFFLTDSTKNFLRGSLYFNTAPNEDSLAPVISFIREDVEVMIHSLRWDNTIIN